MESEGYGLSPRAERECAMLACTDPEFWERLGKELEPEKFEDRAAQLVLASARQVIRASKSPLTSPTPVITRLFDWCNSGSITRKEKIHAAELAEDSLFEGKELDRENLISEVAAIVGRSISEAALSEGIDQVMREGKVAADIQRRLDHASSLGQSRSLNKGGVISGRAEDIQDAARKIRASQLAKRIPTGVTELDGIIASGVSTPGLAAVLGLNGSGKSLFLNTLSGAAMCMGLDVAYISLEIDAEQQLSRTMAALSDVPVFDIQLEEEARDRAEASIAKKVGTFGPLGRIAIEWFGAGITVAELNTWLDKRERELKTKFRIVVVDYASHLVDPAYKSGHEKLHAIFTGLRKIAYDRNTLVWTAVQPKGGSHKKANRTYLDIDDIGESAGPSKVLDFLVSFLVDDDSGDVKFFVPKNRNGPSRGSVSGLPTDYEYGRLCTVDYFHLNTLYSGAL